MIWIRPDPPHRTSRTAAFRFTAVHRQDRGIVWWGVGDGEQALRDVWGRDDLLWWRTDLAPTPRALDRLRRCPHPTCAAVYPLAGTWSAYRVEDPPDLTTQIPIETGEGWADLIAGGCMRIRRGVQRRTAPAWADGPDDPARRVARWFYVAGIGPWHLHWPAIAWEGDIGHDGRTRRAGQARHG